MTTVEDVWDAIERVDVLPFGPARCRAAEEAVRLADAHGTIEERVVTRLQASSAYQVGGEPDRFHVTFAWCVAALDRGEVPEEYVEQVLWQFKWASGAYLSFPQLSLDQARAVIDDMERRYRAGGHRLGPVHQSRARLAAHLGDRDTAEAELRLFRATPRGPLSDCAGCEPSTVVGLLSRLDRPDEAVAAAAGVLDGSLECPEQPHGILTRLLTPYLLTGEHAAATSAHRRAYRTIQGRASELGTLADHVAFCARTGNDARGLEIVERHLPLLDQAPSPAAERDFAAAAAGVLTRVAEPGRTVRHDGVETPAAELAQQLATRARAVAALFDARNGNGEQGKRVEALLAPPRTADVALAPSLSPTARPRRGLLRRGRSAAPPEPDLPADPTELADRALGHRRREEDRAAAAAWRRFDEVCPDPRGRLLAMRLDQRAVDERADSAQAERLARRAAEVFDAAGCAAERWQVLGWLGERLAMSVTDRADEGRDLVRTATEHVSALDEPAVLSRLAGRQARMLVETDPDGALAAVATALAAAGRCGDPATLASCHLDAAEIRLRLDLDTDDATPDVGPATEHLDEALRQARAAAAPVLVAQAQRLASITTHIAHGPKRAAALLAAIELPDEPAVRGLVHSQQGHVEAELGRPNAAYRFLEAAVADYAEAGDVVARALVQVELLDAAHEIDRVADGATAVEDAIPVLDAIGDPEDAADARNRLAEAYRALGEHEQAISLYEWVRDHCVATGNGHGVAAMESNIGATLVELDRDDAAAERFLSAADGFAAAGEPVDELRALGSAAVARATAGRADTAVALVERADAVLARGLPDDDPDVPWQRVMTAFDGARVLGEAGRLEDALARVTPSIAAFRALDAPTEAGIACVLRGRLLADLDRPAEARTALNDALRELPRDAKDIRREVKELLRELKN